MRTGRGSRAPRAGLRPSRPSWTAESRISDSTRWVWRTEPGRRPSATSVRRPGTHMRYPPTAQLHSLDEPRVWVCQVVGQQSAQRIRRQYAIILDQNTYSQGLINLRISLCTALIRHRRVLMLKLTALSGDAPLDAEALGELGLLDQVAGPSGRDQPRHRRMPASLSAHDHTPEVPRRRRLSADAARG